MGEIFNLLSEYRIKVNLLQNSAISFTLALEDKFETFGMLLGSLKSKYKLKYNYDVNLYTIRHYDDASIKDFENGKNVLLKQINRETVQYIIK
jgi:aspartate kinase